MLNRLDHYGYDVVPQLFHVVSICEYEQLHVDSVHVRNSLLIGVYLGQLSDGVGVELGCFSASFLPRVVRGRRVINPVRS
jgi:hypothetical protein